MANTAKKSNRKAIKTAPRPTKPRRVRAASPEYQDYLERYDEFGDGRPHLSSDEFDKLDDELLELLEHAGEPLSDDQVIRIQELEYLLIDTE